MTRPSRPPGLSSIAYTRKLEAHIDQLEAAMQHLAGKAGWVSSSTSFLKHVLHEVASIAVDAETAPDEELEAASEILGRLKASGVVQLASEMSDAEHAAMLADPGSGDESPDGSPRSPSPSSPSSPHVPAPQSPGPQLVPHTHSEPRCRSVSPQGLGRCMRVAGHTSQLEKTIHVALAPTARDPDYAVRLGERCPACDDEASQLEAELATQDASLAKSSGWWVQSQE